MPDAPLTDPGVLATAGYSDSTPGITYTYDRLGRQATVVQNGMTATLAYNLAGETLSESYSGGTLGGLSVTNGYDQFLRRTSLVLQQSNNPLIQQSFGYDTASRLQTATDNTGATSYSATYSYLAKSPLVSQIAFKQGTTTRMTTTKQYDYLNRLQSVSSANSQLPSPISYAYNNANQRIRSTLADVSYWLYEYDSLGQVRSGRKYWSDQTPVAGQQFQYGFDDIGNRTQIKAGGDQSGAGLRSANYSANNLNQYTSRDVPGAVDIMGLGFATNAVTVNNQTAYRKGEYFRKEVPVSNGSAPLWQSITVAATNQSSVSGNQFVPKTPEQFGYDPDGNLTNDGRWNFSWDAENRLLSLVSRTNIGPQQLIRFEYDSKGRRIHKQVWPNTGGSGNPTNDVKFVYDGWNLLADLNATNNAVIRSYLWGSDLSGSMQGAGGVGGLLEVSYNGTQTTNCFVAFDGNGNVAALADAAGTNSLAQYEYGPFGEVIRATGPIAKANPFRFSTKYQDDETDLLYYGYRYEKDGRWLSRDPLTEPGFYLLTTARQIAENADLDDSSESGDGSPTLNSFLTLTGPNVYAFVGNDSPNEIDGLGLVIVGFYGANAWFSGPNEGNVKMKEIADAVGAPIYRSLDIWDPYQYLLNYFRNGSGACNTDEPIKIFGHSWGGISAVKLSRWVGRSALRNHETDVYVIDPVSKLRLPPTSVPSNVKYFWNRYQTAGEGVYIPGVGAVHGRKLTSYAQSSDQVDLNPSDPAGIDHFTIIDAVRDQLIQLLKN
ncbi:MAG: RHS repeat-associated core domain-containing protein [Verrucomicrobiota bacterium]